MAHKKHKHHKEKEVAKPDPTPLGKVEKKTAVKVELVK